MNSPTSSEVAIARQGVIAIERRCGVTVDYCQWASKTSGMFLTTIIGRLQCPIGFYLQLTDVSDAHRSIPCFLQASLASSNCALKGLFTLLGRLGAIRTTPPPAASLHTDLKQAASVAYAPKNTACALMAQSEVEV